MPLAATNAPVRSPEKRSRRRMAASAARTGNWQARPTTNPPSTAQASVTAAAPSSAPAPSRTQNASRTAAGVPASLTCIRRSRASTSASRPVSTAHWRTGPAAPAPGESEGDRDADEAGSSSADSSSAVSSSSMATEAAARSALTRPAECGPAASGSSTASPEGGGAAGGMVKPALVLEK